MADSKITAAALEAVQDEAAYLLNLRGLWSVLRSDLAETPLADPIDGDLRGAIVAAAESTERAIASLGAAVDALDAPGAADSTASQPLMASGG